MLTVLVPAHNEAESISATLASLWAQTTTPDRVVVIADNCSDATERLALENGAHVFVTVGNRDKKAGALNQYLDRILPFLAPDDRVMVMDADSILDSRFLEEAERRLRMGYAACGGVFSGKAGGGFVGMLQRNEYARYARDVKRKNGRTLVLTGTATLFTAQCLQSVTEARQHGVVPARRRGVPLPPGSAHVYDTEVLTEDNELTFALLHLGHKIIAPAECSLQTEVMQTWGDLWRQRHRWKRGAIENDLQYGLTRHTAKYWGLQIWGLMGVAVTAIFLLSVILSLAILHTLHFHPLWIGVSGVYMVERSVTVRSRGWKMSLLASILVVEMTFDIWLQAVHVKAFCDALRRKQKSW